MNELEKLRKLLHHWMEHNIEHAATYKEWAEKAASLGNKDLSGALEKIYRETVKMNGLFEEAIKSME